MTSASRLARFEHSVMNRAELALATTIVWACTLIHDQTYGHSIWFDLAATVGFFVLWRVERSGKGCGQCSTESSGE